VSLQTDPPELDGTERDDTESHVDNSDLVLILDREISALRHLHYRMTLLRLTLLDGTSSFVQLAADEAETATAEVVDLDGAREAACSASATLLGLPASTTLTSLVDHAPDSHLAVLRRLLTDLAHLSRAIAVLRDSTRGLAEEGRRGVLDMLDLTEPAAGTLPQFDLSDESAPRIFVGDI